MSTKPDAHLGFLLAPARSSPPSLPCRSWKRTSHFKDSVRLIHETLLGFLGHFHKRPSEHSKASSNSSRNRKFESFTSILLVVSLPPQYVEYVWTKLGGAGVKYRVGVTSGERPPLSTGRERERRIMFCHMVAMFVLINSLISAAGPSWSQLRTRTADQNNDPFHEASHF